MNPSAPRGTVANARAEATTQAGADAGPEPRPWKHAAYALVGLGTFWLVTYPLANWLASRRAHVGSIVFGWEQHIPFIACSIIPYCSIDVLYVISPFVCTTRAELGTHVRRLLTTQIIAVSCFILFPLRFTFVRPETEGVPRLLFEALGSVDQPYNQAPSLHIALLVILWEFYLRHVPRAMRWPLHLWFATIGVSVLTTYQHHFFDVPTGALLGFFCLWLWPSTGIGPWALWRVTYSVRRLVVAAGYLAGAVAFALLALWSGPAGWMLFWPAISLLLVTVNYVALGPDGFQKSADGRMSAAGRALLAPYLIGVWLNARLRTRQDRTPVLIGDDVWLGRIPSRRVARAFSAVVDLCAELPAPREHTVVHAFPLLDRVAPDPARLKSAAACIERARAGGAVLVCSALGYSRAPAAIAAWLVVTGRTPDVAAAIRCVATARPRIAIDHAGGKAIAIAAGTLP